MKPDQLIKRRGKLGLIKVKANLQEVKQWVADWLGMDQEVRLILRLKNQCQGQCCGVGVGLNRDILVGAGVKVRLQLHLR